MLQVNLPKTLRYQYRNVDCILVNVVLSVKKAHPAYPSGGGRQQDWGGDEAGVLARYISCCCCS